MSTPLYALVPNNAENEREIERLEDLLIIARSALRDAISLVNDVAAMPVSTEDLESALRRSDPSGEGGE